MHEGSESHEPCASCGCDPRAYALLEARYRALTESFPNGIIGLYDHDLRYVVVHGMPAAPVDLRGKRLRDVYPPDVYERDEPALQAALRGESTESIVTHAGRWFRVLTLPVRDGDGRIVQGMVMSQDITRLKQTERRLAEAVDRLSLAASTAGLGIWEADPEAGTLSWNREMSVIYGLAPGAFAGTFEDWLPRMHPDDRQRVAEARQTLSAGGRLEGLEFRIVRPDGEIRHVRAAGAPLDVGPDDGPRRVIGVNQDITALRRGEARLRESEARYRSLFDHTSDAAVLADDAGIILEANPAVGTLMGRPAEQLIGLKVFGRAVGGDEDEAAFWHGLQRDGMRTAALELERRDGQRRHVQVSAWADVQPGLHLLVARDVTDQRRAAAEQARLEAQSRQAQKLEAVGLLTGGVAHDFNNLLHVIMAQTEEATFELEPDHPAREPLGDVRAAAERARRVVAQLLAFARKQVLRPQRLALDAVIGPLVEMLEPLLGRHIRVGWHPGDDLPPVYADLSTLEQVVMNLCLNARDAMPDGGTLHLRTRAVDVAPSDAGELGVEPGRCVELIVQDDGVGMPPDVAARVFDPFFTTKPHGTGMGLSTVYGIVRQHGGAIRVDSEPGVGTTFTVLWPGSRASAPVQSPEAEAEPDRARSAGRILLAEDDPLVAKVTVRYLEEAGYTVRRVGNGAEAVRAARDEGRTIDLLLLDILMPEMTGPTAYEMVAREQPELPVVFMSGYADLSEPARRIVSERPLLRKPFERRALLDAVRDVLARSDS